MKVNLQNKLIAFWMWAKDFFWRRQSVYAVIVILIIGLIVVQLSLIPKGFANVEADYSSNTQSLANIVENPLSLPHKLASYTITNFSDSIRSVRAVSIVFFGLCVIALYRILKRWHSEKIALFATVMFATNASSLAAGRLATPLVLIFGWSIIISLMLWLQHGNSSKVAPFSLLVLSAILLYIPGAPYFFILLAVFFGDKLLTTIKNQKKNTFYVSIVAGLVVIMPLVYSFISDINVIKQWFLLPQNINLSEIPANILKVPSAFIYQSPENPLLNVGTLPVLDVASGGLFLIGLYVYQKNRKLERTKFMILTAFFGIILGALGQVSVAIVLLLPYVYSVVAAGISYILDEWYSIFPKNPFARSFGLILITFVVLMSTYYQLTRFLVVWPQAPETREVYNQSSLIQ